MSNAAISTATMELAVGILCIVLLLGCRKNRQDLAVARWMEGLLAVSTIFFMLDGLLWVSYLVPSLQVNHTLLFAVNTFIYIDSLFGPWAIIGFARALNDPSFSIRSRVGAIELGVTITLGTITLIGCLSGQFFYIDEAGAYQQAAGYLVYEAILLVYSAVAVVIAGFYAMRNKKQRTPLLAMAVLPIIELVALALNMETNDPVGLCAGISIAAILTYSGVILNQARELEESQHEVQRRVAQLNEEESQWRMAQVRTQFDADETLRILDEAETLCDTDPIAASESIEQLAATLRKKADAVRRQAAE